MTAEATIRNVWSDSIGTLFALQDAVKVLFTQETISKKLGAATDQLMHYLPTDFPDPLRPHFARLMAARIRAMRPYTDGVFFDFGKSRAEHRELRQAILDLYKACLLDLGATRESEFIDIIYPSMLS